MESPEARAMRRALSGKLTRTINTSTDEELQSEVQKFLPGIIFNDGVKPFQLFRMGYTWHTQVVTVPQSGFTSIGFAEFNSSPANNL